MKLSWVCLKRPLTQLVANLMIWTVKILPGVNLLFDRSELHPFDIGACLQARQPVSLIVEASLASYASSGIKYEANANFHAKVYIQSSM